MDGKLSPHSWLPHLTALLLAGLLAFSGLASTRVDGALPTQAETPLLYFPLVRTVPYFPQFLPIVGNKTTVNQAVSYVEARSGPAFDVCSLPSLASLKTWWTSSPYRMINIYLGGPAFPKSCNYSGLDSAYLAAADQQGWTFILTWSGWQAPCKNGSISYDKTTAYNQGADQADKAVAKARSLGFTHDLIIYDDIEAYSDVASCHQAVAWFVSGWVDELHDLGHKAGIYGTASNINGFRTRASSLPDDIWAACWFEDSYTAGVSVYDVPDKYLSDSLWSNHQRILQYTGDHAETYGTVRISGIDSDVVDGPITAYGLTGLSAGSVTSASLPHSLQDPILGAQPLAGGAGWAWTASRLWWTADGGVTWQERALDLPASTAIRSAFFLNARQGWLAAQIPATGAVQVLRTQDGGVTWTAAPLPDPQGDLAERAGSLDLDFVDAQTGWASITLQTSAIFSEGRLFRTLDGGQTWTELSLPAGGEVHFVDSNRGWLSGGPGGGQLFSTADGGQTWLPLDPAGTAQAATGASFYGLPAFTTPQEGLLPLTLGGAEDPRLDLYATHDGGGTWTLAQSVSLAGLGEISGALELSSGSQSDQWIAALPDGSLLSVSENLESLAAYAFAPKALPTGVQAIHWVDASHAWAHTWNGLCSGEKDSTSFHCTESSQLYQTADAGATWTEITPGT
jgi:photosystem II stability/assembly factor-like uncharacterized protein